MAAIASSAVLPYPTDGSFESYGGGVAPRSTLARRLKITGVTAADTATAAVLGFSKLLGASGAVYGDTPTACAVGVDPVNNKLIVGAGPNNETVYLTVVGSATI